MKNLKLTSKNCILYAVASLVVLTLPDCKHKPIITNSEPVSNLSCKVNLDITLKNIFIADESFYNSDGDNMLMEIEVKNNTGKDISFGSFDYYTNSAQSNTLLLAPDQGPASSKTMPIITRGFYLISNEFKTGALKLQRGIADKDDLIEANGSETVIVSSNCVYLRYFLKRPVPREQEKAYNEVLDFLNSRNYSLIYVSLKDSDAFVVPKSKTFKVTTTHSLTSELEKLGKK